MNWSSLLITVLTQVVSKLLSLGGGDAVMGHLLVGVSMTWLAVTSSLLAASVAFAWGAAL